MTMDPRPISKHPTIVEWEDDAYERDGHAHYMYKEIPRSARGGQPHAGRATRSSVPHRAPRRTQPRGRRAARREAGQAPWLRLRVLRRDHGRAPHRITRTHPGLGRAGGGVPLSQPRHRARHPLRRGQPVGRDDRHVDGGAEGPTLRRPRARHRQRGRQQHRPRGRRRDLHARRAGGGGGVDKGVHLQPGRTRAARAAARPHARSVARAGPGGSSRRWSACRPTSRPRSGPSRT